MILNHLRSKLENDSVVEGSTGWKCYTGFNPDQENKTVTLQLTGGFAEDVHTASSLWQSAQVVVRSDALDYDTCYTKWKEVYDSLHNADLSADGIVFCQALASGPLTWTDEKKRICMSMNLRVGVTE